MRGRPGIPRPVLAGLLVGYVLFIGWVVLWPSSAPATATVHHTYDLLRALHLSFAWVTTTRIEFGLNVLMVVPVPFLAALVWPRWTWHWWTAWAFVASGSVELFQGLFLADRTAAFSDVVANTLGALTGGVAALVVKRAASRRGRVED